MTINLGGSRVCLQGCILKSNCSHKLAYSHRTQMSTITEFMLSINITSLLLFLLVFITSAHLIFKKRALHLPPGPFNLPIVGYVPFMVGKQIEEVFAELKNKYGNIVYFKLGATEVVTLNNYDTISEALLLNPEVAVTRPESFSVLNYVFKNKGLLIENGKPWTEQKRFLMRTLKDLGMGKQRFESELVDEASVLVADMATLVGKGFDCYQHFTKASANIILAIVHGVRYRHDDPAFHELLHAFVTLPNRIQPFALINCFPYIRHILPRFLSALAGADAISQVIYPFIDKQIQEHKSTKSNVYDFTNIYLREQQMELSNGSTDKIFTNERLRSNIFVLNMAGVATTSGTSYWAIKMITMHPEIQKKLHQEIDVIIGSGRSPSCSDRPNMPYMCGFLMEVQRYGDLVPIGVPHTTLVGTKIAGYDIPAGVTIMPLLFTVHRDKEIWGDPENFRPERFIDQDGKLVKSKHLLPFSLGKRSCPGENLATMFLFIFLTSILQKFSMSPATIADSVLITNPIGFTRDVSPFQIITEIRPS